MKNKSKKKNKIDILSFYSGVQNILYGLGLLITVIFLSIQGLLYYSSKNESKRPSYFLEGILNSNSGYGNEFRPFYFTSDISAHEKVIIKVNGLPVETIRKGKVTTVYISSMDFLEIDARNLKGSHNLVIRSKSGEITLDSPYKRMEIGGKIYRLYPLY